MKHISVYTHLHFNNAVLPNSYGYQTDGSAAFLAQVTNARVAFCWYMPCQGTVQCRNCTEPTALVIRLGKH